MGLTEERIASKLAKLSKDLVNTYEQASPLPTEKMWLEFDSIETKLQKRLSARPITTIDIDMAVMDAKKELSRSWMRYAK